MAKPNATAGQSVKGPENSPGKKEQPARYPASAEGEHHGRVLEARAGVAY